MTQQVVSEPVPRPNPGTPLAIKMVREWLHARRKSGELVFLGLMALVSV